MIPESYKANFETLLIAARNGHLALVECKDRATLAPRYVICAAWQVEGGDTKIVPFGHLCNGNPYEEYTDPADS